MERLKLVLASGSPRRKELLEQVGAAFTVCPAAGEEQLQTTNPQAAVLNLSAQKTMEIAKKLEYEENIAILGADTIVAFDNEILQKPQNKEAAAAMLERLNGNTHTVYTGVTIMVKKAGKQELHQFFEETKVTIYPMTTSEISTYTATGEPMDKAGAYGIQGCFAIYIKKIDGDYNNVVGLPIARIYQEMRNLGIEIFHK
jgi:septum formation protein